MLIDPTNVTKFDRNDHELQAFWLWCMAVAGKNAKTQAGKIDQFLTRIPFHLDRDITPFQLIRYHIACGTLEDAVKRVKLGKYGNLVPGFMKSPMLDLRTATVDELQKIRGVGPKTARFFVMHSRPNQNYACLDTHVLSYLRSMSVLPVPKTTPTSGRMYEKLEVFFLLLATIAQVTPAELDMMVWNAFSPNGSGVWDTRIPKP